MTNCCWSMKDQLMCSEVRNVLGVSYIPEFPCRIRQKLDGCLPFYPSMFYFSTFWSVSSENISLINYLHANLISGSTLWWSKLSHSEKKNVGFWLGLCWMYRSDSGELTKITILSLPIQEHGMFFNLGNCPLISLSNVLKTCI